MELNEHGKQTGRLALEAKKEMVDMQRLVDFIENDIAKNSRVREFKEQQRLAKEAATEAKAALMEQQKSLKEAAAAERKFIQEEKERETMALKTMMEKAKVSSESAAMPKFEKLSAKAMDRQLEKNIAKEIGNFEKEAKMREKQ